MVLETDDAVALHFYCQLKLQPSCLEVEVQQNVFHLWVSADIVGWISMARQQDNHRGKTHVGNVLKCEGRYKQNVWGCNCVSFFGTYKRCTFLLNVFRNRKKRSMDKFSKRCTHGGYEAGTAHRCRWRRCRLLPFWNFH